MSESFADASEADGISPAGAGIKARRKRLDKTEEFGPILF
jgi:hypothetical protein